jgi:hypothetical protein
VLAQVDVDPDGTITLIDNCSCRRIALSAGGLWRQCTTILSVDPDILFVEDEIAVEITTSHELLSTIQLDFGDPKITVKDVVVTGNLIKARVSASSDAAPGPRTLTILDSVGHVLAQKKDALAVVLAAPLAAIPKPTRLVASEKPKPPQRKKRPARK